MNIIIYGNTDNSIVRELEEVYSFLRVEVNNIVDFRIGDSDKIGTLLTELKNNNLEVDYPTMSEIINDYLTVCGFPFIVDGFVTLDYPRSIEQCEDYDSYYRGYNGKIDLVFVIGNDKIDQDVYNHYKKQEIIINIPSDFKTIDVIKRCLLRKMMQKIIARNSKPKKVNDTSNVHRTIIKEITEDITLSPSQEELMVILRDEKHLIPTTTQDTMLSLYELGLCVINTYPNGDFWELTEKGKKYAYNYDKITAIKIV
jgi:hypothetical protein